jgi:gliding motility-associated-like protein
MNKTLPSISFPTAFFFKNYLFLPCLLFICLVQSAQAQIRVCGTDKGCFTIQASNDGGNTYLPLNDLRVCVGTKIQLIKCTPLKTSIYYFDDRKPSESTSDPSPTHTYTQPGTYTIVQQGSTDDILCLDERKNIVVLATPAPVFSLTTCRGRLVLLNIPSGNPNNAYDEYEIDWGDGQPKELVTPAAAVNVSHLYGDVIAKTVTVTGRYTPIGCGNAATNTVTPVVGLANPELTRLVVNDGNNSVDLFFTPTPDYPTYEIFQRIPPGAYQSIQKLPTSGQPIRITNLDTQANTYCFKVVAFDACNQTYEMGEVCTVRLNATALNNQNKAIWLPYAGAGFQSYQLYRDDKALPNTLLATFYTDNDIRCSQKYCYQVKVKAGKIESVSLPVCVTAISDDKPTSLTNLTASVVDGKTVLTWQKPAKFAVRNYAIERSVNGGAFKIYSQIAANPGQFTDFQQSNDSTRYCYRVSYTDSCNKVADPTGVSCPIWLKKVENPTSTDPYQLEWTPYEDWPAGVNTYQVEWLDAEGNVRKDVSTGKTLKYAEKEMDTTQQVLYFRIKAVSNDGVPLESYSNVVAYVQQLRLFLPDAFTPNEDNLNETYVVKGLFVKTFRMQIFNRWGEPIFVSDDIDQGWDGTYKGSPAPPSTYVCRIEATDFRNKTTKVNKLFILIK